MMTGTQLRMSLLDLLQMDGLTERANKTVPSMIRQCLKGKQHTSVKYLPWVEHTMNTAQLETMGFTPFFLNYGQNLTL